MHHRSIEPVIVDEGYITILKEFLAKLKDIPRKIGKKISIDNSENDYLTVLNTNNMNTYAEELDNYVYNNLVDSLLKTMDNIAADLKEEHYVNDELYDFLEIQIITEYILRRDMDDVKLEDINFLSDLTDSLFDILRLKAKLIPNHIEDINEWEGKSFNEYCREYEKFEDSLIEKKEIFYSTIYNTNNGYDSTVIALGNIWKE